MTVFSFLKIAPLLLFVLVYPTRQKHVGFSKRELQTAAGISDGIEELQSVSPNLSSLQNLTILRNLTVPQLIQHHGYPAEIHTVTTEDGYILEMHRIPFGKRCGSGSPKKVVLVEHGLLCDSSCFVTNYEDKSLAFFLADSCYDVWLGNSRGNTYSRRHIHLSPDKNKKQFWDFSWEDMGKYDLPAEIDYILNKTEQKKLSYIGHSMGTLKFFVCMILRPEYNDKIQLMMALSPAVYTTNMKGYTRYLALISKQIEWVLTQFGIYEFLPYRSFYGWIGDTICHPKNYWNFLCSNGLWLIVGFDPEQYVAELTPGALAHIAAGTSVKTMRHYAQGVKSRDFRMYDYGFEQNLIKYKSETPPAYNWTRMTAPVAIYWAQNDFLCTPQDALRVVGNVVNLQRSFRIEFDKFNHADFIWAKDVVPLVFRPMLEFMKDFDNKNSL